MAFWDKTLERLGIRKGQQPLPYPGRGSMGNYPDWRQMLSSWLATAQPIKPEDARKGKDNAVVSIAINWIATSWQVAPLQVGRIDANGKFIAQPHPLTGLYANPSPSTNDLDSNALISGWIADYVRHGNAYGHIIVNAARVPVGIDYLPAKLVKPVPNGTTGRLERFEYLVNGETIPLAPKEVLHFRHGIDEDYPLQGVSPIAAQYREIVADNSYSDATAGMAANGAQKKIVFTPRATADGLTVMTPDEAKQISDGFHEYTRQNPGRSPFISGAVEPHTIGLSPAEMALNDVRAMPETRIPAALGIPAVLLQLYTGIQKSTYNNLSEAIQQGWRGGILPMMRVFEAQLNAKLLPMFPRSVGLVARWDWSVVPELQDDSLAMRTADREDVKAGILTPDEARARQGLGALPEPTTPPQAPVDQADTKRLRVRRKVAGGSEYDIYSVADAYRRALARNEADALDTLAVEWARAERSLRREVARIEEAIAEAIEQGREPDQWRQEALLRLERIRENVLAEMSDLADRSAAAVETAQREGIASAVEFAEPMARAVAGTPPPGKSLPWKPLNIEAFEALVGFASDGSPLASLLGTFGNEEGAAILAALGDGIVQGENPKAVAAHLPSALGKSRARLETIARTEMLRANREATRRTYAANSDIVTGYQRLSAADVRTCVSCWALHGSLSTTAEIMPTHPNCRCVMVPALKSYAEILGDPTIPDTRTTVPDGPGLFALLPESDQLEVLGPGKLALYQSGVPLSELSEVLIDPQWGPTTREKPIAEVNR